MVLGVVLVFLDPFHLLCLVVVKIILAPLLVEQFLPVARILEQFIVLGRLAGHASGVTVHPEGGVMKTVKQIHDYIVCFLAKVYFVMVDFAGFN